MPYYQSFGELYRLFFLHTLSHIFSFEPTRAENTSSALSLSGTYETRQDYIDALNTNGEWVTWDEATNTVTITSVASFTQALKNASKSIAAFDQLDAGQGENTLFGYGNGNGCEC